MSTRATVIINNPADREQVARWAQKVETGTIVEFRKKTRSNEQNAKLHAMLNEVSDQVVWYGAKRSVEDWKNMFTASLRKAQVVPGIDPGTVVPLGIHTSTMTVDEMSNMIEAIYAFGADPDHPVTFKEPKDPDNQNSDEQSPPSSEDAGDAARAPAAAGEDHDPPSESSPAASILDCAKDMLSLARTSYKDEAEREEVLSLAIAEWAGKLPDNQPNIDDIAVAARAVATKVRTLEQAHTYLSERLDTTVEELGGNG